MRLIASTVIKRNIPGKTEAHHACCSRAWPALTMLPHVGTSGGTPAPRNDSDASARMANATTNVACTISGDSEFRRMYFHMMEKSLIPMTRADSTYSSRLFISVVPRTSLTILGA